ncbi:MAG: hypothetical protein LBE85_04330 [Candidatus Accumulibacter sp.]|jgi:hypothetical protein|nr:hypothetical protein [Accumulibacter sp.]
MSKAMSKKAKPSAGGTAGAPAGAAPGAGRGAAPAPIERYAADPWWGRGGQYIVRDGARRPADPSSEQEG